LVVLVIASQNLLYLLFIVVYGIDIVFTIIQRIILKQNIFEAHRMHLYQYLANEAGMSHRMVSMIYGLTQLLINVFVVILISEINISFEGQFILIVVITVALISLYVLIKFKIKSKYNIQ